MRYVLIFIVCSFSATAQFFNADGCVAADSFFVKWRDYTYQQLKDSLGKNNIKYEEETTTNGKSESIIRLDVGSACLGGNAFGRIVFVLSCSEKSKRYEKTSYKCDVIYLESTVSNKYVFATLHTIYPMLRKLHGKPKVETDFLKNLPPVNADVGLIFEDLNERKALLHAEWYMKKQKKKIALFYKTDDEELILAFMAQ